MTDPTMMLTIGIAGLALFAIAVAFNQYRSYEPSLIDTLQTIGMLVLFAAGWIAFFIGMFETFGWLTLAMVPVAVLGILFVWLVSAALIKMVFE